MITRISTKNMAREDWLNERRKSIGGSEIGAIMGLNKYQSAVSVWANKSGIVPDAEPNEAMIQGTDLEAYVAERFTRLTGIRARHCNCIIRNTDFPHIHANVDRLIIGEAAGLECKTASALSVGKFRGGEFPASYYAQCVAYMAITELPAWYLAVLVLGKEFKVFRMVRAGQEESCPGWCESVTVVDDAELAAIKAAAIGFWQHVEDGTMPAVDDSVATAQALGITYLGGNQEAVDLADIEYAINDLIRLKAEKQQLDNKIRLAENHIKKRMENSEIGVTSACIVTWKPRFRRVFDKASLALEHPEIDLSKYYKMSESRVFKIKED